MRRVCSIPIAWVRASLPTDEWDAFRGDESRSGEFRLAMLLLASAAGYPAVARAWFEQLRRVDLATLFDDGDSKSPGWEQFRDAHSRRPILPPCGQRTTALEMAKPRGAIHVLTRRNAFADCIRGSRNVGGLFSARVQTLAVLLKTNGSVG